MHYNIPASMAEAYQGRTIIVRAYDPSEFPKYLSETDMKNVAYLQLLSLNTDTEGLNRWGEGIPVDLVMAEPEKEFPLLYSFSPLLKKHPVKVSVPPVPEFGKAVRVAASLNFAVRITGGQPEPAIEEEMADILNFYLRHPTVSRPIEYFHSLLFAFFHEKAVYLPTIQEEDPMAFRYITHEGEAAISERFAADGIIGEAATADAMCKLSEKSEECFDCDCFPFCRGYFKWPRPEYSCEGVKKIFQTLKRAAGDLEKHYAASLGRQGGRRK